jgi:hypothetical protein
MTTSSLGTPFLQDAPYPGPAAVASGILSGAESSGYVLVPLRGRCGLHPYRGRQHCNPSPVLVVALTGEQPSPQSLRRLEHEYSLYLESASRTDDEQRSTDRGPRRRMRQRSTTFRKRGCCEIKSQSRTSSLRFVCAKAACCHALRGLRFVAGAFRGFD